MSIYGNLNYFMILKNSFPICYLSKNKILIYKGTCFIEYDLVSNTSETILNFKSSKLNFFLSKFSIFTRILRLNIRCGLKISDHVIVFYKGSKIYELNKNSKTISNGYSIIDGSRPFSFTKISNLKNFDDGVYFGSYIHNPNKNPVSIYKRIKEDIWDVVYTFPAGEIEHIHNIIVDPHKNLVYVLTGDFKNASAIWIAKNNFTEIIPILRGKQIYRGCVGSVSSKGLLYATDTPFENNSIRLLTLVNDNWISKKIHHINGPSIYGCKWRDDTVFSTSVESDGFAKPSLIYKLFGSKRGKGIKENYCIIYKGNIERGFKEIYRVKKDSLPFYLFQFGVLIFPSGINNSFFLPIYHIATKSSLNMLIIKQTLRNIK